ncbi:MAG: lipoate--protein ligase [Bacteroidales bacterium]|nr:lipoate--protein ligase [Bacteroidales bacterium]
MLIIDNNITDPWFNLAAEEYMFRNFTGDIFMSYTNSRSVIIGKHQNPAEEVNAMCLREKNIPMIRRISGGGAVYHDEGNLNYTFIRNTADGKQIDFSECTLPIISFLREHGINAYQGEKNEIRTDGMKISGNAEHVFKNRVLHHGTILFSANLGLMSMCLGKANAIITSRAVKSNRTNVCNLRGRMPGIKGITDLKKQLLEYISHDNPDSESYIFSRTDIENITKIKKEKFTSWEWNYAWGPEYTFSKEFSIEGKPSEIGLKVSKGVINECKFSGPAHWKKVEAILPGIRHTYDDIARVMKDNSLTSDVDLIYNFIM